MAPALTRWRQRHSVFVALAAELCSAKGIPHTNRVLLDQSIRAGNLRQESVCLAAGSAPPVTVRCRVFWVLGGEI